MFIFLFGLLGCPIHINGDEYPIILKLALDFLFF
jgi:hypothetical protein